MILVKNESRDETIIKMLDEVYGGPALIKHKIIFMITTRRDNHGNSRVQDACNKYLTKLYDEKYEQISKGEYVW